MIIMTWFVFSSSMARINFSKQIARKIEQAREVKPIETTTELAEIIKSAKTCQGAQEEGPSCQADFPGYSN